MLSAAKVAQKNVDAPLAVLGGEPVRKRPMPARSALGPAEERIIKEVIGFRQFSLRGEFAASGEWGLVCLAFNLKRFHTLSLSKAAS